MSSGPPPSAEALSVVGGGWVSGDFWSTSGVKNIEN